MHRLLTAALAENSGKLQVGGVIYEPEAVVPIRELRLVPITRLGDALALSLVERLGADVVEDAGGLLCVPREAAVRILEDDRVCQ